MSFYFIVFIILAVFSLLEVLGLKTQQTKKIFLVFSFFLFLFSFLRWETGTDWNSYFGFFNRSDEWFGSSEFEWGYSRINEFVKIYFNNFTVLLFILGSILFSFQSKALLRFSPYPVTSLLFLWCFSFGNVLFIRQSIASIILFYSIRFIQEKKIIKFLFFIILAMQFHRTSIIFIFAWWIYNLKLKPLKQLIIIVISMSLSVLISNVMTSLGVLFGGIIQSKIETYISLGESNFGSNSSMNQIILKGFANKIFIFLLSMLVINKINNPKFKGFLNLYWAGIILYFSTISISLALVRLSFAYDLAIIVIAPMILSSIKNKISRIFLFLFLLCYLFLRLLIALFGSYYELFVPFKTILNL